MSVSQYCACHYPQTSHVYHQSQVGRQCIASGMKYITVDSGTVTGTFLATWSPSVCPPGEAMNGWSLRWPDYCGGMSRPFRLSRAIAASPVNLEQSTDCSSDSAKHVFIDIDFCRSDGLRVILQIISQSRFPPLVFTFSLELLLEIWLRPLVRSSGWAIWYWAPGYLSGLGLLLRPLVWCSGFGDRA